MGVVGDGDNGLGGVAGSGDEVALTRTNSLALQVDVHTLLLGLALLEGVLLDTVDELLTGAGVLDVLNADVDALLEVAVVDTLVQEHADGGLGHVVDDTGLTVVDLVGHTVGGTLQSVREARVRGKKMSLIQCQMRRAKRRSEMRDAESWKCAGKEFSDCTDPFWTAPLTFRSTISPTLQKFR